MIRSARLVVMLLGIAVSASLHGEAVDDTVFASPDAVIDYSRGRSEQGEYRVALDTLEAGIERFPDSRALLSTYADLLYDRKRYGAAKRAYLQLAEGAGDAHARSRIDAIDEQFDKLTSSLNLATISIQKATDAGNLETAVGLGDLALEKFPDTAVLLTAKGEAQYRMGRLAEAEDTFRRALQLDPFDRQARSFVEVIRLTEQAQVSTEFAEWMSIARDKVGDFIVTFLALFAAFVANSLIEPVALQFRLARARRLFERGQYDEFTDLIEGMLHSEDLHSLRSNFRFLLQEKSLEEAREILDRYVNTPDRLPALIRILEREHEKLVHSA